jgi:hypothetical protein
MVDLNKSAIDALTVLSTCHDDWKRQDQFASVALYRAQMIAREALRDHIPDVGEMTDSEEAARNIFENTALVSMLRQIVIDNTRIGGYPITIGIARDAYLLGLADGGKVGIHNHSGSSEKIKNSDLFHRPTIDRAVAHADAMAIVQADPIGALCVLRAGLRPSDKGVGR